MNISSPVDDLAVIRDRLVQRLSASILPLREEELEAARAWVGSMKEDGSWPDVEYWNADRAGWSPWRHSRRVRTLAALWVHTREETFLEAAHRGLASWFRLDPLSRNWWHNQIGTPGEIGPTMLILGTQATAAEKEGALKILGRCGWFLLKEDGARVAHEWTGANLMWLASGILMRCLLANEAGSLDDVCSRVGREIRLAAEGEEGIQKDFSFHQHGPLLYNGGYGSAFTLDTLQFLELLEGTRWQLSGEKADLFVRFLLEGQQWMIHGPIFDYSVSDRNLARINSGRLDDAWTKMDFGFLGEKRRDELEAFSARLKGKPGAPVLSGNRMYWRSDFMVQRGPGFGVSVRMSSTRTRTSELCNEEGKLSHHVADGLTYLYRTGEEYRNIFPVWDWRRLPGTTCVQREDLPREEMEGQHFGGSDMAGGVSDGTFGAAAMQLKRKELGAKKAWFFFEEAWVCLGAEIESGHGEPVLTSLEQNRLQGEILAEGGEMGAGEGVWEKLSSRWVWHGGTGYFSLDAAAFTVAKENRRASWSRIGPEEKEESMEVFSLWLDHGPMPLGVGYAYAVFPGADVADLEREKEAGRFAVLANSGAVQAVWLKSKSVLEAVFWQAGELRVPGWGMLWADAPCLVLVRPGAKEGSWEGRVADPGQKLRELGLGWELETGKKGEERILLPKGLEAGRTVEIERLRD